MNDENKIMNPEDSNVKETSEKSNEYVETNKVTNQSSMTSDSSQIDNQVDNPSPVGGVSGNENLSTGTTGTMGATGNRVNQSIDDPEGSNLSQSDMVSMSNDLNQPQRVNSTDQPNIQPNAQMNSQPSGNIPPNNGIPRVVGEKPKDSNRPKKRKKRVWPTVLVMLLIVAMASASTYTIGYYHGQIALNGPKIDTLVQDSLNKGLDSKIYKSVISYMDENGNTSTNLDTSIAQIYENVSNSVVSITSKLTYYDWFNNATEAEGAGSGVILKETPDKFYIVTNYHVVDGAQEVLVEVANDQMIDSQLVGYDEDADIAVVAIKKSDVPNDILKDLKPIEVGSSKDVTVGERAIAIGNPLGYNKTLTAGFISAVDRSVKNEKGNSNTYIQTDAAINPGNSGGALVNEKGELIGINTAKISETDVEGMGFAIPTDTFMPLVSELIENGYISKPYIGIGGINVDQAQSNLYELPIGVYVQTVYDNTPAQKAGLKEGDVIIGIDETQIKTMSELVNYIGEKNPGDKVTLKVIRDGSTKLTINVTLGDKNEAKAQTINQ